MVIHQNIHRHLWCLSDLVLPGQIATVWQTVLHFGNLEMKTAANYTTISCPNDLDAAAVAADKDKVIKKIENCAPGGSR